MLFRSSVPGQNIIEEIMMKYGLKRQNNPPIVIAKSIPPSEPSSAPSPPVVNFRQSRKKHVARKGTGTSEPTKSEEEDTVEHTEEHESERVSEREASEPQSSTQVPPEEIPPLVELSWRWKI